MALVCAIVGYVGVATPAAAVILMIAAVGCVGVFAAGIALGTLTLVQWGIGGLAAVYVGSLLYRGAGPDQWSVLIAIGLLASGEMASWSIDSRRRGSDDIAVHLLRLRAIALAVAAALALGVVVQTAAQLGGGGAASAALATGAVLVGVAVICLLLWRIRTSSA
ncbi:MAG TPA: hypothetical protein VFK22_07165 [Candidatus Dormibacteraeota bacterium]|nr:hypothetical protein [Candidatus Dormibacteraeota bacterium]